MSKKNTTAKFVKELEVLAQAQAQLTERRLLPKQLDPITAVIGNYPWQSLFVSSGLTTLILFLAKWWR